MVKLLVSYPQTYKLTLCWNIFQLNSSIQFSVLGFYCNLTLTSKLSECPRLSGYPLVTLQIFFVRFCI